MGLLRRAAVRERPPALRAPPHRLRQRRLPSLPDHAGQEGRPTIRVGHPRPPRRARGDEAARYHREEPDRGDGRRGLQRRESPLGTEVHERVAGVRHPSGALGRLRQRLQDPRHHLHGERAVGLQGAPLQRHGLRGLSRAAVLLERRDAAQQPRAPHGRRCLQDAAGPDGHRHVPSRRKPCRGSRAHRGSCARLDDHALDPPYQSGSRRRPRHRVRGRAGGPERHRRRRGEERDRG